ncbi:MAG: D-alanyl-D-alanine carboxypeptidase/D-alanyl-D-alanine-endopeptidase, partial [Gemmatimonadales bacterium]
MRVTIAISVRRLVPAVTALSLAAWPVCGSAQTLSTQQLQALSNWYHTSARRAPGHWGIAIANQQGDLLWSIKPDQSLVPASTVKLFTTGFARTVLGADAKLETKVVGSGYIEPFSGEWIGSWALELNGDPSLENPAGTGPRLAELADQLARLGIKKLTGPLEVRSASGPAGALYPEAWSRRHWGRLFAPLIGALTLHENVVRFTIRAGPRVGTPAEFVAEAPEGVSSLVANNVRTVAGSRSRVSLIALQNGGWVLRGTIGVRARPRGFTAVARNPKLVLERAWAAALKDVGIGWSSTAPRPRAAIAVPVVLAEVESPTFDSIASDVNRRSLNLGAELMLRWAAREDGPAQLSEHVRSVAGVSDGLHLVDGSGLSGDDRASPLTFVHYLANLPLTDAGRNFPLLLPANGDGTLRRLSSGLPEGVVRAKTGTLGNASTISGYLGRPDGVMIVSVMYNGGRPSTARQQQWKLFRLLGADGIALPNELPL